MEVGLDIDAILESQCGREILQEQKKRHKKESLNLLERKGDVDENFYAKDDSEIELKSEEEKSIEKMTVIDEINDDEHSSQRMEDTEMVSEDELRLEGKDPLDTEAVSDEELPDSTVKVSESLLDTEAVSEDELPLEADQKRRKKINRTDTEAVSEDELPYGNGEKKKKQTKEKENDKVKKSEATKRKIIEGEYDPSSPTSENSQDDMPATKKAAVGDSKATTPKPSAKKVLPELEKYWKAVKDDATDFTGWTYLLQYVDQENDVEAAREAYDSFLSYYPYCYGYWRKYADYEKRKSTNEKCEEVFDRGLKAIPLSVDLWIHYLNYCKTVYAENEEHLRAQFERAIEACGLEFRSDRLWETYIKWETEGKRLTRITALYDRLLATPTQGYTTHFDNFQEHVSSNPPQTILPVDDFLQLRREVLRMLKQYDPPASTNASTAEEEAPPGAENDDDDDNVEKGQAFASITTRMDEETSALREKIVSTRRKVHKLTVAAVAARWNYEEGIKRPYFHVKPLERCQLKNWKEYLDFETEQGNKDRIIILYERCLIACALYEEFWIRFVRYLESIPEDMTEKIRDVYERACLIHHKKKPNLHLQWAVFEESKGCFDKAASILENLEKAVPNLLPVAYRRINLERRKGDLNKVCELYELYLANAKNKAVLTNMTVKYARFTWKILNDVEKAVSILRKAVEKDKDNTRLYLQLIDMGLQKTPIDENSIISILDQFLNKEGEPEQKLMFAQRKIEFLEDFGSDITKVQKAHDEYQKYLKQVKERKKKLGDTENYKDGLAASSHSLSATKKQKSETNHTTTQPPLPPTTAQPSTPTASAYPTAGYSQGYPGYHQGQYPAGYSYGQYSQQPQAQTADATYTNNYQNWNAYSQGSYNYGQPGWGGYYANY
ncbi:pre-mRNA-splicing factor clf-1, putative [Pediculus humanus corporis]|uniref:Pre-mRNA-processing factor 39 n=1 Tax=Pediculus humanus subsp. corporis TaxID=121224 RepID=E0VIE6_PEDHC|nr:pre-mRNA-splicing factor clf-1, putative [Pediculus humanus corporis]EEB13152.1 pre-mRNA-splicing factor clf-1, putative [Pediculus humanus corporis]